MFSHLLRYMPPMMYKNREGALYGILFPLAFGLIYLAVFTGLLSGGNALDTIPVAVVFEGTTEEVQTAQDNLQNIAVTGEMSGGEVVPLEDTGDTEPLMAYIEVTDLEEGRELANDNRVDATIVVNNSGGEMEMALEVAPAAVNNFTSSIIYSALSSYAAIYNGISTAYNSAGESDNPLLTLTQLNARVDELQEGVNYTVDANTERGTASYSIYFYASLAYLCIFFMSVGTNMVSENEAYYSPQALRATAAPVPKAKRFLAAFVSWGLPSLLVVYMVLFLYYMNDVPLGNEWGRIVVLMTLGVSVGLLLGTALAALLKTHTSVLSAVSIALPLVMGAFSGLMSADLKVMINENMPWLNKINPVSLINDGIYYLNNYPTFEQYNQNVMILIVFVVVLLALTIFGLRRSDYASL